MSILSHYPYIIIRLCVLSRSGSIFFVNFRPTLDKMSVCYSNGPFAVVRDHILYFFARHIWLLIIVTIATRCPSIAE